MGTQIPMANLMDLDSALQCCFKAVVNQHVVNPKKQSRLKTSLLFSEVSFSIHHIPELDHYANVCISSGKKMADGQKQIARA